MKPIRNAAAIVSAIGIASVVAATPAAAQTRAANTTQARTETVETRPPPDEPQPTKQFLYLNGEAGFENVHMQTLSTDIGGLIPSNTTGPMAGLGAGFRLLFLTLGARARVGSFQGENTAFTNNWQVWTLDAEAGLRIPLGRLEPYLAFSGGYASLAGIGDAARGLNGVDIHGYNLRATAGLDYWFTKMVSLGASFGGELLVLTRPGVPIGDLTNALNAGTLDEAHARLLEANGTSAGYALTGALALGLHF